MLTHTEYTDLFTLGIAFNFALVLISGKGGIIGIDENTSGSSFFDFFRIFKESCADELKKHPVLYKIVRCESYLKEWGRYSDANTTQEPDEVAGLRDKVERFQKEVSAIGTSFSLRCDGILTADGFSSICFLLGLCGLLVLFAAPFSDARSVVVFLHNMNIVCILFLVWSFAYDRVKESRTANGKIGDPPLKPKRRYVVVLFLFLVGVYIAYILTPVSKYGLVEIPDKAYGSAFIWTAIVNFSAIFIYSIHGLLRIAIGKSRTMGKISKLGEPVGILYEKVQLDRPVPKRSVIKRSDFLT